MNNKRKPFSKRHGFTVQPPEIKIREDAPENLRHFVLQIAIELGLGPSDLRECACAVLHVRPDPNNWSEYPNVWGEVEDLIYGCDWFRIYDFIERVYLRFQKRDKKLAADFEQALNDFFIEQGMGWQMADGEIITRGTEAFEATVYVAVESLDAAGRNTARDEIHEALTDLSRRPKPDLTGAIQHGMAALECVARDACGDPKATLGDILKRHPDLLPKPLDTAIEKAWGYASEMGRHIREGRQPDRKEAELIVGLAATVSTYLSR
ncbi:MAG: hypothetical protein ABSH28_04345 [Acidobacteriota bacterium]|jgi:hypothetical protein